MSSVNSCRAKKKIKRRQRRTLKARIHTTQFVVVIHSTGPTFVGQPPFSLPRLRQSGEWLCTLQEKKLVFFFVHPIHYARLSRSLREVTQNPGSYSGRFSLPPLFPLVVRALIFIAGIIRHVLPSSTRVRHIINRIIFCRGRVTKQSHGRYI